MDNNPLYPPRTSQQDYRPPVIGLSSQSVAYQSIPVDLHDSRHSQSSQMSLLDQAQNIEIKISKEFSFYKFLLGLDFLVALSGLAFLKSQYYQYYELQYIYPSFLLVIMVGSYAKARLSTFSQRYTFIACIIIAILNFWAIMTALAINYYNNRIYLCYLAVSLLLHSIIAFMALNLEEIMQERDILLVPFKLHNDPHVDSEWQQVYALDPQDQLTSLYEKYTEAERMIERLTKHGYCWLSLAMVHCGVLLLILSVGAFQTILLFLGVIGGGIYAKVTPNPLGQICFFALYSITSLAYAFIVGVHIISTFSHTYKLYAGDFFVAFPLLCSPYIAYNVWVLAKWMQEREILIAHLRRFHNVLLPEQISQVHRDQRIPFGSRIVLLIMGFIN